MKIKNKNWIAKIAVSTGALTAVIAPIVTAVAYQNKNVAKGAIVGKSQLTVSVEALNPSITYQDLPSHFNVSPEGFKSIYQTLENIFPSANYDFTKLLDFYENNAAKANDFIAYVNATLMHRGFWGDLWNGIKHIGETIGGAVATAAVGLADGVTGGQISALNNTLNTVANFTANSAVASFHDVTAIIKDSFGIDLENLSNSDSMRFGISIVLWEFGPEFGVLESSITNAALEVGVPKVISAAIGYATKLIVKATAKDFLSWSGNKIEKTIKITDAQNDSSIPTELRNNLKIGEYYFNDNNIMYKFTITQ